MFKKTEEQVEVLIEEMLENSWISNYLESGNYLFSLEEISHQIGNGWYESVKIVYDNEGNKIIYYLVSVINDIGFYLTDDEFSNQCEAYIKKSVHKDILFFLLNKEYKSEYDQLCLESHILSAYDQICISFKDYLYSNLSNLKTIPLPPED